MVGDEDLLVEVYGRLQRQSWGRWRDRVPHLLDLLESDIPVSFAGFFFTGMYSAVHFHSERVTAFASSTNFRCSTPC